MALGKFVHASTSRECHSKPHLRAGFHHLLRPTSRTHANEDATQGSVIGYVLGMPSSGNLVKGWLGDVNVATTDQVSHVAVEEGQ